jgi:alanyl-tRNA synthetase
VHWDVQSYDEALSSGAMALFGEKYAENVRVVGICEREGSQQTGNRKIKGKEQRAESRTEDAQGDARCFSKELCGGTHVHRTGEIGTFVILSEGSVGSGVRRIEAATGALADEHVAGLQATVSGLARRLNATPAQIDERIAALEAELEAERKKTQQLSRQAGRAEVDTLLEAAERVDGASIVVARVPADSVEAMREMGDLLRDKLGSAVVVLGSVVAEKPSFLAMVTKDLSGRVHAGNLIKQIAVVAGGGGGGGPDMAQAGGKDAAKLDDALGLARDLARESLAAK